MWTVPGTKIAYKQGEYGIEVTYDGEETWGFTFRSISEIRQMHPTLVGPAEDNSEDNEREIFGETLDDHIPDDMWDMIKTPAG